MHPGFHAWWKRAQSGACAADCHAGAAGPHWHRGGPWSRPGGDEGGGFRFSHDDDASAGFGVRRPLRFLAHKLDLDDEQVTKLAAILSALKTERAQAAVDERRRTGKLAESLEGEAFDEAAVREVEADRVKTEEKLQHAVTEALRKIHAALEPEQRKKLAYLLRTGALTV